MKLLLILLFPTLLLAQEKCTEKHVHAAMELNREHRELYRQDGHTSAAKIINKLIFMEKIILLFSYDLDHSVRQLQNAGVAMWCEDLVAMDTVPVYRAQIPPPLLAPRLLAKKTRALLKSQMKHFKFYQRESLYRNLSEVIKNDLNDQSYNCLTRHFLEAAARSLKLSRQHLDQTPPELKTKLHRATEKLIKQMGMALNYAANLDRQAATVQAQGIPVLCQEMPPISWQDL